MIPGVRGRLITSSFVRDLLPEIAQGAPPPGFRKALESWWEGTEATLGPASSVRAITEAAIIPLLRTLDLTVTGRADVKGGCLLHTGWCGHRGPEVLVVGWNQPLSPAWRAAVLDAIAADCRWSFCTNGTALRLVDSRRTWSRDYLEIDLALAARTLETVMLLWTFARGEAVAGDGRLLDRAIVESARHGLDVCRALGSGVLEALASLVNCFSTARSTRRRSAPHQPTPFDGQDAYQLSVAVLFRVLFLLFAEARGLVPLWNDVYRDRYSLDTIVTSLIDGKPCRGVWEAVLAISRLAYSGCRAGDLKVNAFNGGLFSPADTAALDRLPIADGTMARAITAVSTRPVRPSRHAVPTTGGERVARRRILYRELDVEQLGAVYEHALEYEPRASPDTTLARTRDVRKASATFYTPRAVAAWVVRHTLEPLVHDRTSDEILSLRILDPAMGSGAFLVAACRYLASAAEDALVRDGRWHAGDVTPSDRVELRREVALRCLFGVDVNPMAVQLARLSLWLTTLASDKPLSFLDHHLVTGDSLVGATVDDVRRRTSKTAGRQHRQENLPLFSGDTLAPALEQAVRIRLALSRQPDESARIVREKERTLANLRNDDALTRWARVLDLWCAGWFWPTSAGPGRATFGDLCLRILHGRGTLPAVSAEPLLAVSEEIASARRFLHWPLAFPEVFAGPEGAAPDRRGFDAVIGNPPWDMVKGDSGPADVRRSRKRLASQLADFARESGVYRVASQTHLNRYQLFVERALQLARTKGRIGLVVPSGLVNDAGTAAIRRHLFDQADVDSIIGFDNRAAIFPIHRSVRFALVTATRGRPTAAIACRFGLSRADELEDGPGTGQRPLLVTRRLLSRISGDEDLGVPELVAAIDLRLVERISTNVPRLSSERGWKAKFGRELNATDDRSAFRRASGDEGARLVVQGRHLDAFRVSLDTCDLEVRPDATAARRAASGPRLAYRDVASPTNRLTLIAAIVPATAVTTHTLFCLKTPMDSEGQQVLCALLNSFVANYLVRMRVHTHVTIALVSRLPVPFVSPGDASFLRLALLSKRLAGSTQPVETMAEYAELQAISARLYGLVREEFEHVLSTFPLVSEAVRRAALTRFEELR